MTNNSTVLVAAFAALLGGVVGGATATWLMPRVKPTKPAATQTNAQSDLDDLSARVDVLEAQIAHLAQPRVVFVPTAAGAASAEPAPRPSPRVDDPVFETAVRDVMDRMERERLAEREARRAQRQAQHAQVWADRLTRQLGLTDEQKTAVLAISQRYLQNHRQLSEQGSMSREERSAKRDSMRADAERELKQVLSPGQMKTYQESENRLENITRPARTRD